MSWEQCVNVASGTPPVTLGSGFSSHSKSLPRSPIDTFYSRRDEILTVTSGTDNYLILNSMLVSIVSATEAYFREVFSGLLVLCPISRSKFADTTVSISSVFWAGDNIPPLVCESVSFSDQEKLKSYLSKAGLELTPKGGSPLTPLLQKFENVCQIRHCIVHAGGCIQPKNAVKLGLSYRTGHLLSVRIGKSELEDSLLICSALVRSVNQRLFKVVGRRWATDWRLEPGWKKEGEGRVFSKVWSLFASATDINDGSCSPPLTRAECLKKVKAEFGLP